METLRCRQKQDEVTSGTLIVASSGQKGFALTALRAGFLIGFNINLEKPSAENPIFGTKRNYEVPACFIKAAICTISEGSVLQQPPKQTAPMDFHLEMKFSQPGPDTG